VAQLGAAEGSAQHGSAAPVLQAALAGPAAAKPTGTEAPGAGVSALTPLAFLRAVMRHPDTPMHLRMRVASLLAPYFHAKAATPEPESETEFAIEDQYGFSVEPELAKNLQDTQKALDDLAHGSTEGQDNHEQQRDVLIKRLAQAKKSLHCPEAYHWDDLAKDQRRLVHLAAKREARRLTPAEDAEQLHLTARAFSYENSAEHAEREQQEQRLSALRAKWEDYSITEEEQKEFDCLRVSVRNHVLGDPVYRAFHHQLCLEARIRGLPAPTSEDTAKILAAKQSSGDIMRKPVRPPKQEPAVPAKVDFAAWLRGEVSYRPFLLRKAAKPYGAKYLNVRFEPDLIVGLIRDKKVVFEHELSPYFAWVLRIYDEALKSGKSPPPTDT
jgi:hypothetical protein